MPTIKGLRRRGYTAIALNAFCTDIGVSRNDNTIEVCMICYTHTRIYAHSYQTYTYVVTVNFVCVHSINGNAYCHHSSVCRCYLSLLRYTG
jgi:glutamyl/glutaminyl-tRNA synthetase